MQSNSKYKTHWLFLIPSLAGIFLFTVPIHHQGTLMVSIAVLGSMIQALFHQWLPAILTIIINACAIVPVVFLSFIIAGFFMPLLLGFGLPEFVGLLFSKIMRLVFLLPNRAAVNCIASWLGDGSVGILIASKQYEMGIYTGREAAIIGTT